jgi:hypothetical protein
MPTKKRSVRFVATVTTILLAMTVLYAQTSPADKLRLLAAKLTNAGTVPSAAMASGSVTEAALSFSNNTTANATTSAHGLAPKGTVGTTQFWRQDWTLATPSGAGDVSGPGTSVASEIVLFDGTSGTLVKRATGTGLALSTSGVYSTYAGTSCTNQFPRSLNASGAATCASVGTNDITGVIGIAHLATGTPDGTKFVRDDGTLAVPAGTGMVRLAQVVTSGSQATVDFSGISGSYSTLKLVWLAQDTAAGTSSNTLYLKVNNDGTSGNYTSANRIAAVNAAAGVTDLAAAAAGMQFADLPNAGNTGIAGSGEVTIVGYAGTTFHKNVFSVWRAESTSFKEVAVYGARWKSTSAITQLTVGTSGTAFTDGSVFTLYGIP